MEDKTKRNMRGEHKRQHVWRMVLFALMVCSACGAETGSGAASATSGSGPSGESSTAAPTKGHRTLVVYYSATGNTERVAEVVARTAKADMLKLEPVPEYTKADLDYRDESSCVVREHDDESLRNVALRKATADHWTEYDTVFIGYPIWWGIAAWPVDPFVKGNDFSGKQVIPFCTSASSPLGSSGEFLAQMAGTGDWKVGMRFASTASDSEIAGWVKDVMK